MHRSKSRGVSRAPEWSERAYWHSDLRAYIHGLEIWRTTGEARLYVAEGARPKLTGLASALNMMAPEIAFAQVMAADRIISLMTCTAGMWRTGEPLNDEVEWLSPGTLIRLPAIVGRSQYVGPVVRRADRPGIVQLVSQAAA